MNTATPQPRIRQLPLLLAALCTSISAVAIGAPAPAPTQAQTLRAYAAPVKPTRTVLGKRDSREFIEIKFAQDQTVRLRNGRLTSTALSAASITQLENVLSQHVVAKIEPLFHVANEASLQQLVSTAQQRSGRTQSDLNQWYRIRVQPGTDIAKLTDQLNALNTVEIAYPARKAAPLPSSSAAPRKASFYPTFVTPDHTALQGYAKAASLGGIDALYARTQAGGNGANVKLVDIEYGWYFQHEDLSQLRASNVVIANGTPNYSYEDHGTGVFGEIASDANAFGVTGLVPNVKMHVTNAINAERGYDLANSIIAATQAISPGDVILLEQQTDGPANCNGYVAVEQFASVYDAIVAATSIGIHVVEAAGNGGMNLDDPCFGSPFPQGRPDSGAIIVGAGASPSCGATARSRLSFSTYGNRVNLQGWGECVVTTGYGGLSGSTVNDNYTNSFNGTSSASPIVASAIASLSSIAKQRGITLTPLQMRQKLVATGTPQSVPADKIGPLPNLRAAIDSLTGGSNQLPVAAFSFTSSNLTVTFTDSSTDADGTIASRNWNFGDGTSSTLTSPSKTYSAAGSYTVTLTVTDNAGGVATQTKTVTVGASNVLANNVPVTGLSAATGIELRYTMVVPANATGLKFTTTGSNGDADLYAKFGSAPTTSSYTCRSESSNSNETCTIATAQAGTYHVLVKAYSAFTGLSLTGSYSLGSSTQTYTNGTDVVIPNNATVESSIAVTGRSGNAPSNTQVAVNIIHTYIGDLKVDLVAPDGSVYVLHNRTGGSTDNINQTYTVNLSSEPLNGTWKLRVNDNYRLDDGRIDSWSITF